MHGPARRLIESQGREYGVYNAAGDGRGIESPDYGSAPDTTIVGVLEQRGSPRSVSRSSGEDVESDLEIRAVVDDSVTLRGAGAGHETLLEHPSGQRYRVLGVLPEDSGVTVLTVVRE